MEPQRQWLCITVLAIIALLQVAQGSTTIFGHASSKGRMMASNTRQRNLPITGLDAIIQELHDNNATRTNTTDNASAVRSVKIPSITPKCPSAPTKYFLRTSVEPNTGAEILTTMTGTLTQLAHKCQETVFCVAIDTLGNLWTGIKNESLVKVASKTPCYGIYIHKSPKKWTGMASSFSSRLEAAHQAGQAVLAQQQTFWNQVKTVRSVIKTMGANPKASARDMVAQALGLRNGPASRRLLQATNQSSTHKAMDMLMAAAAAPAVYDPRDPSTTGGVSYPCPVANQGDCGSCVSFASIGAAEIAVAFARKQSCPVQLSQQWMFFCNGLYQPTCETGWFTDQAASVLESKGATFAQCNPYFGFPSCSSGCNSGSSTIQGKFKTTVFGPNDIVAAKKFLREEGAIYSYFRAYSDIFKYTSGVYEQTNGTLKGGHAVVVVGYNDEQQAWIVRNSWGTTWGEAGYFLFSYNDAVFMKGGFYNIVGVSYTESSTPVPPPSWSPAPAYPPSPAPATVPPAYPPSPAPAPQPRALNLTCTIAFYDQPNYMGMSLQWSQAFDVTAVPKGLCSYISDFGATTPSFAYKASSLELSCSCAGTSTSDACYNLAKDVTLMVWKQSFQYYKDNGITDPETGTGSFAQSDCDANGCSVSATELPAQWKDTINSAAICYSYNSFRPSV